jgi:DNA/RNA endonuclease G (NUC1)
MDFSRVAMEESFLMSNVSPQAPEFNRGIWKDLESEVREWAKQKHRLYVVTGPVFSENKGTIGQDRVLVPGYFFKVLFDENSSPEMIAFVLPNQKSDRPLSDFAVSVDELEKMTGFAGAKAHEPAIAQTTSAQQQEQPGKSEYNFYLGLVFALFIVVILMSLRGFKKKK